MSKHRYVALGAVASSVVLVWLGGWVGSAVASFAHTFANAYSVKEYF